jgi:hypothetical protein
MRETDYATELASAEIDSCRIERLFVKPEQQEEIRFSWWPGGKLANRPLDLPESALLSLLQRAIKNGVFSASFLRDLHAALYEAGGPGERKSDSKMP